MKAQLKTSKCSLSKSQKINVSSTKRRRDTTIPSPPLPLAKKPLMKPPSIALFKILENTSIAKIKRKGERGPPCLRPLELWKKPVEVPLIRTKNRNEDIHHFIHLTHFAPKPIFPWLLIRIPSLHGHRPFQYLFCRWPPFLSFLILSLAPHFL